MFFDSWSFCLILPPVWFSIFLIFSLTDWFKFLEKWKRFIASFTVFGLFSAWLMALRAQKFLYLYLFWDVERFSVSGHLSNQIKFFCVVLNYLRTSPNTDLDQKMCWSKRLHHVYIFQNAQQKCRTDNPSFSQVCGSLVIRVHFRPTPLIIVLPFFRSNSENFNEEKRICIGKRYLLRQCIPFYPRKETCYKGVTFPTTKAFLDTSALPKSLWNMRERHIKDSTIFMIPLQLRPISNEGWCFYVPT